jgi:hypothetical protein
VIVDESMHVLKRVQANLLDGVDCEQLSYFFWVIHPKESFFIYYKSN